MRDLQVFFYDQLKAWSEAQERYERLSQVLTKRVEIDGESVIVQHNPARAVSSLAKLDAKTLGARPCFLCQQNRPKEQRVLDCLGRYHILVNPFPIFRPHFTIAATTHRPQTLSAAVIRDMTSIARTNEGHIVFFNGAHAGASAPDHLHLQMIERGALNATLGTKSRLRGNITLTGDNEDTLTHKIIEVIGDRYLNEGLFNLLMEYRDRRWIVDVYRRKTHRPSLYFDGTFMISPGAIDMAGVIIAARHEDFENADAERIAEVFRQVTDKP